MASISSLPHEVVNAIHPPVEDAGQGLARRQVAGHRPPVQGGDEAGEPGTAFPRPYTPVPVEFGGRVGTKKVPSRGNGKDPWPVDLINKDVIQRALPVR
ncbi:hypothetical protein GCM10009663_57170 [Kitasatospora arboriphila]|uniref:Uncharacterized protein n=1 Tax=Kitasatospora arboriphila TaxID=258052 RepID=A0ABN1TZH0_9ACTN